jgi:hypothetical protein
LDGMVAVHFSTHIAALCTWPCFQSVIIPLY